MSASSAIICVFSKIDEMATVSVVMESGNSIGSCSIFFCKFLNCVFNAVTSVDDASQSFSSSWASVPLLVDEGSTATRRCKILNVDSDLGLSVVAAVPAVAGRLASKVLNLSAESGVLRFNLSLSSVLKSMTGGAAGAAGGGGFAETGCSIFSRIDDDDDGGVIIGGGGGGGIVDDDGGGGGGGGGGGINAFAKDWSTFAEIGAFGVEIKLSDDGIGGGGGGGGGGVELILSTTSTLSSSLFG